MHDDDGAHAERNQRMGVSVDILHKSASAAAAAAAAVLYREARC